MKRAVLKAVALYLPVLVFLVSSAQSQVVQPVIRDIRLAQTNVLVTVEVPAGVQRLTLESRTRFNRGTWVPTAVKQLDPGSKVVTFRLPRSDKFEVLRARADFQQPLPQHLYTGKTGPISGGPTNTLLNPMFDGAGPEDRDGGSREVAESDIWKIRGDTLYFFNQYRGLQVIDIANPDKARVSGSLALPASGEQMYVMDSGYVVLLARAGCFYYDQDSLAVIVGVTNGVPAVATRVSIPGYIQESRMVGSALYIASQTYRPVDGTTNTVWEWGTVVTSVDLEKPLAPVARDSRWYPGYGNVIYATDTYLFVVNSDPDAWDKSEVSIIDITAPDGTMAFYASVRPSGRVIDKFKLNYAAGVLTLISEDRSLTGLVTRLETFHLPPPQSVPPAAIVKLGSLELGKGESLHATRFDGTRAYVVTFFQIDPLWIVDFTDPAAPRIAGELEVLGWSTYIEPMGPRLVSVGVESNRVAVSLFNVADPAKPELWSRVLLGENYSWTEANYDEKAFSVLKEPELILLPYSGDTTNGWTSRVQLIDLKATSLQARGIIEHASQPRRATFHNGRVLSLSGVELFSVEIADRDKPAVRGTTQLAWSVDRVFSFGGFLLQIGSGNDWSSTDPPGVRVSSTQDTGDVLNRVEVGRLPIVGASLKEGLLYLAQSDPNAYFDPKPGDPTNVPKFVLTVWDARELPDLPMLGKVETNGPTVGGWMSQWQATWPASDTLVWGGGGFNNWWRWMPWLDGPGGFRGDMWWPGWLSGGGHFLAFDVGDSTLPKFVSYVDLTTNDWWSFSEAFVSGPLVYVSHYAAEPVNPEDPTKDWVQRAFLDVIDYTDAAFPTLRKPVNIPGDLRNVSRSGELLYTTGFHWTNDLTDWTEYLDASAYDGVAAHHIASMPLPSTWPHPVLGVGSHVILGRADYGDNGSPAHSVEVWTIHDSGAWQRTSLVRVANPVDAFEEHGGLLIARDTAGGVLLFNFGTPGQLVQVGFLPSPGCIWFGLENAEGSLDQGAWIPLGLFGVLHVPIGAK